MKCPSCDSTKLTTIDTGIEECSECKALFTTHHVPLGKTYAHVLPYWDEGTSTEQCEQRYFDFQYLSSKGLGRRHGWFNPATRKITQTG